MDPVVVVALGLAFGLLLVAGAPVALALGGSSAVVTLIWLGASQLPSLPMSLAGATDSHVLLAVPFFILAGTLLAESTLSRRLVDFAAVVTGRLPGGLGIAVLVAGVFLAGISGSGPADVAILGTIMVPMLVEQGYHRGLISGLIALSGSIGIIIPPSIALLVYGSVVPGVAIEKLFLGGVGPGLCLALVLGVIVAWVAPRPPRRRPGATGWWRALRGAAWALVFPLIILGGIYLGVFTPTESAAVAVVYALFVSGLVYRELTWARLCLCLAEAARITAGVMLLVATAAVFARLLALESVPQAAATLLRESLQDRWVLLLGVNLLVLAAGCLLDAISVFYIVVPILLPALLAAGFDPVHLGVVLTVNLAIGQVTPPVAVNLFVSCELTRTSMGETMRRSWLLLVGALLALVLTNLFPALTLWLPNTRP